MMNFADVSSGRSEADNASFTKVDKLGSAAAATLTTEAADPLSPAGENETRFRFHRRLVGVRLSFAGCIGVV